MGAAETKIMSDIESLKEELLKKSKKDEEVQEQISVLHYLMEQGNEALECERKQNRAKEKYQKQQEGKHLAKQKQLEAEVEKLKAEQRQHEEQMEQQIQLTLKVSSECETQKKQIQELTEKINSIVGKMADHASKDKEVTALFTRVVGNAMDQHQGPRHGKLFTAVEEVMKRNRNMKNADDAVLGSECLIASCEEDQKALMKVMTAAMLQAKFAKQWRQSALSS